MLPREKPDNETLVLEFLKRRFFMIQNFNHISMGQNIDVQIEVQSKLLDMITEIDRWLEKAGQHYSPKRYNVWKEFRNKVFREIF